MTTPKVPVKFTYQDYCLLPEEKRYELIEGELLMVPSPSWTHQTILKRLFSILDAYVTEHRLGEVRFAPLDVILSEEDVVQPDLLFLSKDRLGLVTERGVRGAPDLVVEVLSEASSERDRTLKRKVYAKYGVREYWIVDPGARTIEVAGLGPGGLSTLQVYPVGTTFRSPLLEGFELPLDRIFLPS